ncbi:MAG: peroxide stress protein YaaA, partial [Pseudomonadales bacterium]
NKPTDALNAQMKSLETETLVNLASNEYFKSINLDKLKAEVVTPVFKDYKHGKYKIISFVAKKARGLMSAWIIRNRIETKADLKKFDVDGYRFNEAASQGNDLVFLRDAS